MSTYIKGKYRKSIFISETGYHIGIFKVKETNDDELDIYVDRTITFTGYFHELNDNDTYKLYGKLVEHDKYGEQFQVESYERCKPEEKDSIIEFLTSGLFKGIGEKKAKKIVDVLGKNTLDIILNQPNNLILIPTITKANADMLHNKLKEYESSYETILYLKELGFSTKDSMLIYNYYKDKTIKTIEENIYVLVQDIPELTFKKIDTIALATTTKKDDLIRIRAAIIYIIKEVCDTYGHSYLFKEEIYNYLLKVLQTKIDFEVYENALMLLNKELNIIIENEKYYLKEMYDAECLITKRFLHLNNKKDSSSEKLDETINLIEQNLGIKYNEDQLLAIKSSYIKNFLIVTGGPGTGKTTIVKGITELYKELNRLSYQELQEEIALVAPTGRAAKRISESTWLKASTIHRFLKWQKETNKFQINEYNKSKIKFLIIDEASMIDTYLMANLLKGISKNCKIIIVGDDQQLPSVGPGQILHDLISSNKLNVVELKTLYRQEKDSNIITLAYDVRNGNLDKSIFNIEEDLTFIECSPDKIMENIKEIALTYKDLSYKDFQILAPMYKTLYGIDEINKNLQQIFNKKEKSKKEILIGDTIFREQDKVIQLSNMPEENVYNGDIGIIEKIVLSPKKEIHINFDNNIVKFTPTNFNKFRLAYAISIHKAQGSEFDVVVMPLVKNFNKMLYRKLVYTGITRSKRKLYLIGDITSLKQAIDNVSNDIRRSTIKEFLINGIK